VLYGLGSVSPDNFENLHAEKQIARKAFELALDREFRNVIRRAKDMAGNIEQPTDAFFAAVRTT
jgi:hypothetical protein